MSNLSREEAIAQFGKPDKMGHITRYSDSSFYDERCVMCGLTDPYMGGNTIFTHRCPSAESDPVRFIKEINKWGFWDETWSEWHGNWNTEEEARNSLIEYSKDL